MKTRSFAILFFTAGLALVTAWTVAAHVPAHESGNMQGASPALRLNIGPTDPTIDPAVMTDTRHLLAVNQLFLGLVRADEETGAPIPELATSWTMSPDATVFTFTVRSGLTWTDGNPLTAYDVRYGLLRSLAPATQSESAFMLFWIENAEEYNNGTITDKNQVGVTTLDYTHLRFTLKQPAAFFPSTLAMPVARPTPAWAIAAHPADWTEPQNIVTNGPFRLADWTHGVSMTLEQNPGYYDVANVQIEGVSFSVVDDATAWTMYQAGQLDSVLVPPGEWDSACSDPVLSGQLRAASRLGTYYYGFNTAKAPFDTLLVRKAFVAAVNRQGVIDLVAGYSDAGRYSTAQGLPQALTFNPPGMWGHVDGTTEGVGIRYDPAQARQWLTAAGYPNGQGLPPITLAYDPDPAHEAVAEYIQQDWTENLSVTVALSCTVSKDAYFELLRTDPPQVWELRWSLDHYDGYNFLYECISCWGRVQWGNWTNPTYDSLLSLAVHTADLSTRASLYRQAEEILVETDAVMLPIYYFADGIATQPYLERTYGLGGSGGRIADWRITVYEPAHADFVASPTSGPAPLAVTFTDTSSGDYTSSLWAFGDGVTSTEEAPTHTYAAAGVYTVALTISGPGGTDSLTRPGHITVYESVHADFTAWPTAGFAPLRVAFANTSSGDYAASLWDFGDGITATLAAPTHTYSAAGSYTVTLTVSGPGGSDTRSRPACIKVDSVVYLPMVVRSTAASAQAPRGRDWYLPGEHRGLWWADRRLAHHVASVLTAYHGNPR